MELAYLDRFLQDDVPVFGLVRTGAGYLLLDRAGLGAVSAPFHGTSPWGPVDVLSWLYRKRAPMVRQAESTLRRVAVGRSLKGGLSRMLQRHLPRGTAYFNTGHSALDAASLAAIRAGTKGPLAVLIHDTIPLDHPEYQRPGTAGRFLTKLQAAGDHADLILCNSQATADRLHVHLPDCPDLLIAPLGVTPARPDPTALPPGLYLNRPYFVTVGTIEPRKAHDLLLDVWDDLAGDYPAQDLPGLMICGSRGWNNKAVFARLDALPADGPIRELPGLSDGAIAALLQRSRGLLFPSRAEGYGLPPLEAASMGVPVYLRDLPVYRETLGHIPVYATETQGYLWRNIVEAQVLTQSRKDEDVAMTDFSAPTWADHFDIVFKRI